MQAEKQRQADLAAEQQRNADTEHNNGVYIEATLQAVPLPLLTAAAKGVKRNADKIVLPAHLGAELMKQSAHEANGTAFWEVSAADGRSTCCSALDFSGPDGVVMLPPKVVHSLWGYNVRPHLQYLHLKSEQSIVLGTWTHNAFISVFGSADKRRR